MTRLLTILLVAAAVFAGSAAVAESSIPGFGVQDTCAAVFTEDASACGSGPGTILAGPWYENGVRLCVWYFNGDGSVRVAPC